MRQLSQYINRRDILVLSIILVMMFVFTGCANKDINEKLIPTMIPTITKTPTLAPTPLPTATPTMAPLVKRWIPLNKENTIYRLPLDQRIIGTGGIVHLDEWEGDLFILNYMDNDINMYLCDIYTGVVKDNLTIPGNDIDLRNAKITETGDYRFYNSETHEFIYLSHDLKIVDRVQIGIKDQFNENGYKLTYPFITEDKQDVYYVRYKDTDAIELVWKNLASGQERILSEEFKGYNSGDVIELLSDDHMLLLSVFFESTDYYYIDLDKFQVYKQAKNVYMEVKSQNGMYGGMVSKSMPELIFGYSQTMEDTQSIAYENSLECYNSTYFFDDKLLSTFYTEYNEKLDLMDYFYRLYDLKTGHLLKTTQCLNINLNGTLDRPKTYFKKLNLLAGTYYDSGHECIYLWDLNAVNNKADLENSYIIPYRDNDQPDDAALQRLQIQADQIADKYGVRILIGENCKTDLIDYVAKQIYEVRLIEQTLEELEGVLKQYPSDFFDQIGRYGEDTLVFYLVGEISSQGENTISSAAALYNGFTKEQYIAIDCSQYQGLKQTLYHEISHAIDTFLVENGDSYNYDQDWNKLNPDGFQYEYSYSEDNEISFDYCYWSDEPEDTYFIDTYAKTYQTEDRARLMEYALKDGIAVYQEYPHLMEKLEVMYEEIYTTFDTTNWRADFFQFDNFFGIPE